MIDTWSSYMGHVSVVHGSQYALHWVKNDILKLSSFS